MDTAVCLARRSGGRWGGGPPGLAEEVKGVGVARWRWALWPTLRGGPRRVAASCRSVAGWARGRGCQGFAVPPPPISPPRRFSAMQLVWWQRVPGAGIPSAVFEGRGPGGPGGWWLVGQAGPSPWFDSAACLTVATVVTYHRPGCAALARRPGSGVQLGKVVLPLDT